MAYFSPQFTINVQFTEYQDNIPQVYLQYLVSTTIVRDISSYLFKHTYTVHYTVSVISFDCRNPFCIRQKSMSNTLLKLIRYHFAKVAYSTDFLLI